VTELLTEPQPTAIPFLSGDVKRLEDLFGDGRIGAEEGSTGLPGMLIVDEFVRANAPTACEFVDLPFSRVIDPSLLRHLVLIDVPSARRWKGLVSAFDLLCETFAPSETVSEETAVAEVIAAHAIDWIVEETALSQENVAVQLLGVTRGTLHNWRKKGRVGGAAEADRVLTLRDAIVRLREKFGRGLVGSWLTGEDGARSSLLRSDDLTAFTSAVDALLAPAVAAQTDDTASDDQDFLVLASFPLVSHPLSKSRAATYSSWEPVEVTGSDGDIYASEAEE
jgi:DNA-binding transcriptional regulator YiaG